MGDTNAQIGKEDHFRPKIDKQHNVTNKNGKILTDFSTEWNLRFKSTDFERKVIHERTWRSTNAAHINQINHALTETKGEQNITNVRTYTGPDVNSEHSLIGIEMKQ